MKIEVSVGELVDKVTILEIKLEKITNQEKMKNVRREYDLLRRSMESLGLTRESEEFRELKRINLKLWETEDLIRIKESQKRFDDEFIRLARSVYFANDERSGIKRRINLAAGSKIIEEKEHAEYDRTESP